MRTLPIIALLLLSGCLAQRRGRKGRESQINIEQLLLQADSDSIKRLLNEAVEANHADEQAVVSVQQSNSVEISSPAERDRSTRPKARLFRAKALKSRTRQRPKIQVNTLSPDALIATTTTERPSRSSLFSAPRKRFRPRPRAKNKDKDAKEATTQSSTEPKSRRFPGFIRRPRPRLNIGRPATTTKSTTTTRPTTATTTPTTTTTTTTSTTTTTTVAPRVLIDIDNNDVEYQEEDYEVEGSSFVGLFPTAGSLLDAIPTTPQPIFSQTFGPALPPQFQRSTLAPQRASPTPSLRSRSRSQHRVRTRPSNNERVRSRGRQQNVELIPVEKKVIKNIEKPRSSPIRIRPAASQRRRNRPSQEQVRRPAPTQAPTIQPFQPFQFPLAANPNPTPSFFEDIPFVNAVNQIAPSQLKEIVEYEDEEPIEEFAIRVTPASIRRPAPTAARARRPAPTAAPTRRPVPTAAPTRRPLPAAAPTRRPGPKTVPQKFHAVKPTQNEISGDRVKVLDRYSHRNNDGSFTWGYQSADGSFKEETIGVDCITIGRYGYIDPLGEVREFTYQSGNECDPITKQPVDEESSTPQNRQRGYFDYNANRYVTKDGRRGKLMVNKNKMRRGRSISN